MAGIAPRSSVGQLTGTPGFGGGRIAKSAPKAAPKGPARGPLAPQDQSIMALVNAILSAQEKPLQTAEAARQKQQDLNLQQMQGARNAMISALQGQVQPVADAYTQAQQSTDALGRQAASYFQGQNPNTADQNVLKAIGAPVSQQQSVAASNQAGFNGGPGYVLGAQIPGASLAAQRAAQVGFLSGLPAAAGAQGQAADFAFRQSGETAHQNYLANVQKILAQTPGLVQGYQQQALVNAQNAQRALVTAAGQLANAKYLAAKEGLAGKQFQLAVQKEQDAYNVAQQNATIAQQRANQTGTYQSGQLTVAQRNAATAQKNAATRAAAARAAAGKTRGKNRQTALKNRRADRTAAGTKILTYGRQTLKPTYTTQKIPTYINKNTGLPAQKGDPAAIQASNKNGPIYKTVRVRNKPQTYNQARAYAMGLPEVQDLGRVYGYSPQQVSDFVDSELQAAGYKVPPRRGRRPG